MAFKASLLLILVFVVFLSMFPSVNPATAPPSNCRPPSTFSPFFAFGDSTTDTGNAIRGATADRYTEATKLPYGETFFKMATGRFSDGRLMVDDLAQALKLPLLPPHLASTTDTTGGSENYAVAGATALNVPTVQWLAGVTPTTSDSLDVQIGWFKVDTAAVDLSNALVYLGEVGGNDYNYALAGNRAPEDVTRSIVPTVIKKVADSLERILSSGVNNVVLQGQFPMGCLPIYLNKFADMQHDEHGCVAAVSAMSDNHNQLLKEAVATASTNHPDANIVFFDTSAAYLHILDYAAAYGFTNVQGACYAGGLDLLPGLDGSDDTPCPNPQNYISWDGIHMTEAMYADMMKLFLTNANFASPFPNVITSAVACR